MSRAARLALARAYRSAAHALSNETFRTEKCCGEPVDSMGRCQHHRYHQTSTMPDADAIIAAHAATPDPTPLTDDGRCTWRGDFYAKTVGNIYVDQRCTRPLGHRDDDEPDGGHRWAGMSPQ